MEMVAGAEYVEAGFTAKDSLGNDLTASVVVTNNVNTAVPGIYTINYEVADGGGNSARMTRTVVVSEPEPVAVEPNAPTLTIIGSSPIILHQDKTNYTEQGAKAYCEVDGDISNRIQISGLVVSSVPGTYRINYSVFNSAGLEATTTREVRVLAPTESRPARTPYSFSGQGKAGSTVNHVGIVADAAGLMDLQVASIDKNMTIMVRLIDSASNSVVMQDSFSSAGTKQYAIDSGRYTLSVTVEAANGNAKYGINLLMPQVTPMVYEQPEVPLVGWGDDGLFVNPAIYLIAIAFVAVGTTAVIYKKKSATK
jgi:hypothetical protein